MTGGNSMPKNFGGVTKRGTQIPSPLCYEETFLVVEKGLIGFPNQNVGGGITEEGLAEVYERICTPRHTTCS
jgi:hypothetical protein